MPALMTLEVLTAALTRLYASTSLERASSPTERSWPTSTAP